MALKEGCGRSGATCAEWERATPHVGNQGCALPHSVTIDLPSLQDHAALDSPEVAVQHIQLVVGQQSGAKGSNDQPSCRDETAAEIHVSPSSFGIHPEESFCTTFERVPEGLVKLSWALDDTLRSTEESRRVMGDDPVGLHLVVEMLCSPSPQVRQVTCTILGRLAADESTMSTILWNFGMELVPLIHDEDDKVVEKAMWAFSVAVRWQGGAQVFVDAKLLDTVLALLESPRPFVRTQACRLVGKLASHEHIITAVLESKPCTRLVFLLRDEAVWVNNAAVYALTQISRSLPGAKAVVNAKVLDHIPELLDSSTVVRDRSCELLDSLFHHEFVVPAILRLDILARLVSISESELPGYNFETDPNNLALSTDLLVRMSRWPDGVSALAETDVLDAIQRIIIRLDKIAKYIDGRNQTQIYWIRVNWGTIQNNIVRYKEKNQQR
ncbi:armadillo-type protein [Mycena haematopus]|nr:armadillo-type protein [Mycena haematopus]